MNKNSITFSRSQISVCAIDFRDTFCCTKSSVETAGTDAILEIKFCSRTFDSTATNTVRVEVFAVHRLSNQLCIYTHHINTCITSHPYNNLHNQIDSDKLQGQTQGGLGYFNTPLKFK